jgi:DNA invertase Pin-like site-specific DNA recombinase
VGFTFICCVQVVEGREEQMERKVPRFFMHLNHMMKKKKIHIGELIRQKLEEEGRSSSWLAKKIHCHRTNIYKIFQKENIDVEQLMLISEAMNIDFFIYYSEALCKNT